jgi:hypothetical protein
MVGTRVFEKNKDEIGPFIKVSFIVKLNGHEFIFRPEAADCIPDSIFFFGNERAMTMIRIWVKSKNLGDVNDPNICVPELDS